MSTILSNWLAGRGLPGVLVIDGHVHIGEWPHATTFRNADETVAQSVAYLDANGIDACCVVGGGYLWEGSDYRIGNDFLVEVCRRLPDRLIPFLHINPNDTRANVLAELQRMYDAGVRCIKLINSYQENYPGDGPNLMALYEFASTHRMLVFNHAWTPEVMMTVAAQFPDVDFVFGHYGPRQDPVLRERPNVYANTWTYTVQGFLDRAIANVGAGKLLVGSDGFLNPMSVGIGPVVFANATDAQRREILGVTQARLLDKVGALPAALRQWLADAPVAGAVGD